MDERTIGRQIGRRVILVWLVGLVLVVSLYALPELLAYFNVSSIDPRLLRFLSKTIPDFAAPIIVISFAYEYWLRRHTIRYFQSLMFSERVITDIISDSYLLEVMKFGLARVLNDKPFASDIFDFVRHNAISQPEKRYGERNTVILRNATSSDSDDVRIHYYDAEIRVTYEKVIHEAQMWFVCVRGDEQYNELMLQQEIDWRWVVPPLRLFPKLNETFYTVECCVIEGLECQVRTKKLNKEGDVGYFVNVPKAARDGQRVSVEYVIRLRIPRFGHSFQIGFPRPTKGGYIELDYSDTDINAVYVSENIVCPQRPKIRKGGDDALRRVASVEIDDSWVLPKSGVSFVWYLNSETNPEFKREVLTQPAIATTPTRHVTSYMFD